MSELMFFIGGLGFTFLLVYATISFLLSEIGVITTVFFLWICTFYFVGASIWEAL